ncbi:MAG: rhodanese-like domain-containing protein [Nitrospinae bacterium]|nr:rhodanese-like domain-containing protein [Nitrospinota bacterium]
MDTKKKIYLQYAAIFIFTMLFGAILFIIKTSDIWRSSLPKYEYSTILPKELLEMMNQNKELIIIDTRIKEYFKKGHIKGAANLPYTSMKTMTKLLKNEMLKDIVIYSEDGERSKKICEILTNLGFSKIKNLHGGIKNWIDSGGEIVLLE